MKLTKQEKLRKMKMNWKDLFPKNRYFETEDGILYNNDVLEVLKQLPNESYDWEFDWSLKGAEVFFRRITKEA